MVRRPHVYFELSGINPTLAFSLITYEKACPVFSFILYGLGLCTAKNRLA